MNIIMRWTIILGVPLCMVVGAIAIYSRVDSAVKAHDSPAASRQWRPLSLLHLGSRVTCWLSWRA